MGTIEIHNPENNRSCQIPYIALHALAHGSFAYNGTVHQNQRIDAIQLYRTVKTHMLFISDDSDKDGLKDNEETYFGFNLNNIDANGNSISDSKELADSLIKKNESLPTEPGISEPYIEHVYFDGIQLCFVCGEEIPMGIMRIHNPLFSSPFPFEISYYAYHFMKKGSFANEIMAYEGIFKSRINPIRLAVYLNIDPAAIKQQTNNKTPKGFILGQNYPNPFNPETKITYKINK